MIKIDKDILRMSDEEINAALVLIPIYLKSRPDAHLEKRKEMFELELWTRVEAAKLA